MRLLKLFSKTTQFAMLFCFCLPFLKGCDGCGVSAEELAAQAKYLQDSILAYDAVNSFEKSDSIALKIDTAITSTPIICEPPEFPIIENKSYLDKFLSAILQPNGDYSGYGLIVLGIALNAITIHLTLLLFIILVLLSIIISFRKKNTYKWIFILSIIETICLCMFYIFCFGTDILYGFWLTLSVCLTNVILLSFILKKNKNGTPIK